MNRFRLPTTAVSVLSASLVVFSGFFNKVKLRIPFPEPPYHIAFANFGPLNEDIFIADGDGLHARPWLSSPANDYNASFSPDGNWIVFTSERNGSADIYRAHPDG